MNPLPTKFSARRADRSTRIALRSIRATIAFDQLRPLQIQWGAMANIVGHYLSFEGRLARLPFFSRGVFLGVIAAALAMASIPLFAREGLGWWFGISVVIASLVLLFVGGFSLTTRRLHDMGLSGYHAIWVSAAQAAWAPLSYGPPEVMLAGLPLAAVGVWLLFWPGNRGPNRFGERPG
jgi:uncharacterized membrane protein YhaH (DUF805 family)